MIKTRAAILALGLLAAWIAPDVSAARRVAPAKSAPAPRKAPPSGRVQQARQLLGGRDDLGFRIFLQRIYAEPIRRSDWYAIKVLVSRFSDRVGLDMVPYWNSRNPKDLSDLDQMFSNVDNLMLTTRFDEAFEESQKIAQKLKREEKSRPDARALYNYALHAMARSLFGARRFEESAKVYQWIPQSYPAFRQVLFEKMWAAYRAGRVDLALGAIASQRSHFFPANLPSETYLLQTYLLRKLCREQELVEVEKDLKDYVERLTSGNLEDWASSDPASSVLWRLVKAPVGEHENLTLVSRTEREMEKKKILDALSRRYQRLRPALVKNLQTIQAFLRLALVTDTSTLLKPVEALKDRDQLLKMDLEVWPADSGEDWIDEVGKHILIGESLCGKNKSR